MKNIFAPRPIDKFTGKYFFLSNYFECPVEYAGYRFASSEAAFQAAKVPHQMDEFVKLTPDQAKFHGRHCKIRPDWEEVKTDIMYDICLAKFTQNPDLKKKLLATGNRELIEGNTWRDTCWGVYKGRGENRLGKILMEIRTKLAKEA